MQPGILISSTLGFPGNSFFFPNNSLAEKFFPSSYFLGACGRFPLDFRLKWCKERGGEREERGGGDRREKVPLPSPLFLLLYVY